MVTHRSLLRRVAPLALVGSLFLVACGDEKGVDSLGRIGGERFVRVQFKDLPRPTPHVVKEHKRVELIESEQLDVPNMTEAQIIDFYKTELAADGWIVADDETKTRAGQQISWSKLGRLVVVTTAKGTTTDPAKPAPTSLSLSFARLDRPGG